MSYDNQEKQFAQDLENYLKRGGAKTTPVQTPADSQEYEELLHLGEELQSMDFSKEANQDKINQRFMDSLRTSREEIRMKKISKAKKFTAIAASVAIMVTVMSQTTLAQDLVDGLKAMFSTDNIQVGQYSDDYPTMPVPEDLIGQVFDENGNTITEIGNEPVYNKDRTQIAVVDGKIITIAELKEQQKAEDAERAALTLTVTDQATLNDYTSFEVKLPQYLPEGYTFAKAEFYKETPEDAVKNTPYISMYFTNEATGGKIFMQQRDVTADAGIVTGTTNDVKYVDINGAKGIMYDNSLDWEANGVMYLMSASNLQDHTQNPVADLLEIAKSIK